MIHVCHADGCHVSVPRKLFMCRRHWFMVPAALRQEIWRTYQPGQEEGLALVSDEYMEISRAAIAAVAAREGR